MNEISVVSADKIVNKIFHAEKMPAPKEIRININF